jgi:hypothetical protein
MAMSLIPDLILFLDQGFGSIPPPLLDTRIICEKGKWSPSTSSEMKSDEMK